jgi:hypothetical protein
MVCVMEKVYMAFSLSSEKGVRTDASQCSLSSSSHLSSDVTVLGKLLLLLIVAGSGRGPNPFVVSVVSNAAEHTYRCIGRERPFSGLPD